jgi:hypothetical protein
MHSGHAHYKDHSLLMGIPIKAKNKDERKKRGGKDTFEKVEAKIKNKKSVGMWSDRWAGSVSPHY